MNRKRVIGFISALVVVGACAVLYYLALPQTLSPHGAWGSLREGEFRSSASGVYLGDGILLTNWHVASGTYGLLSTGLDLPSEYDLTEYERGETDETFADNWICPTDINTPRNYLYNLEQTRQYRIEQDNQGNCTPQKNIHERFFRLSQAGWLADAPVLPVVDLLYANRDYDIAVLLIDDSTLSEASLDEPCISDRPLTEGDGVTIVGHPTGTYPAVSTRAVITDATPQMLQDPDPNIAPDYRFSAYTVIAQPLTDANTVTYGSSGSPVYNAHGHIVGIIWTGENPGRGGSPVWLSPASVWLPVLREAEIEHAGLERILSQGCALP
jgi:hypothetical protein